MFEGSEQPRYMNEPAAREVKGLSHASSNTKRRRTKKTSVSTSTVNRSNFAINIIVGLAVIAAVLGGGYWIFNTYVNG